MPPSQVPQGKVKLEIESLGIVQGLEFSSGVRQFTGIPYATLTKRWTHSRLSTSWPENFHDRTKLG